MMGRVLKQDPMRENQQADIDGFRKDLANAHTLVVDKTKQGAAVDRAWVIFKDGLLQCVDQHVPSKLRRTKPPREPPWLNFRTRKACRNRTRFYHSFKKSGDPYHRSRYKSLRRDDKRLFRRLKRDYQMKSLYAPLKDSNTKPISKHEKNWRGNSNAIFKFR